MHVLLEGVFPLHMEQLLKYIVEDIAILTLTQINSRIKAFPFAYFNDKPSPLKGLSLEGTQSGSYMHF